jgi:hypothetical protein
LQANAAVDAGVKIDPIPIGSLLILTRTGMDAGDRTGSDAIGHTFASFGNNRMGHSRFSLSDELPTFGLDSDTIVTPSRGGRTPFSSIPGYQGI